MTTIGMKTLAIIAIASIAAIGVACATASLLTVAPGSLLSSAVSQSAAATAGTRVASVLIGVLHHRNQTRQLDFNHHKPTKNHKANNPIFFLTPKIQHPFSTPIKPAEALSFLIL